MAKGALLWDRQEEGEFVLSLPSREELDYANRKSSVIPPRPLPPRPFLKRRILYAVANHYGLMPRELVCRRHWPEYIPARHMLMYLMKTLTNLSISQIGAYTDRDHSTVLYALAKVEAEIDERPERRADFEALVGVINEPHHYQAAIPALGERGVDEPQKRKGAGEDTVAFIREMEARRRFPVERAAPS